MKIQTESPKETPLPALETHPTFSIILPVYNEEALIPDLHWRISSLLNQLPGTAEVILVDDGSKDKSYPLLLALSEKDPRFKVIHFARNFGHQMAITAGMDFSSGDATIIMDADLQDPPEVVLDMVREWKKGFDVVYARREARKGEGWFKKLTASLFYRVLNRLTDVDIPADVGDFRLVDRKALDAFNVLREKNRYVRGMFSWIGYRQKEITYVRDERKAGETKYPLRKMLKLAADGIVGFSNVPLRLALNLGFLVSGVAFLTGIWALMAKLYGHTVTGWTSLAIVISFLGGIQLILMGILGLYVGRIHDEVKNRPLYLVRSVHGFSPKSPHKPLTSP